MFSDEIPVMENIKKQVVIKKYLESRLKEQKDFIKLLKQKRKEVREREQYNVDFCGDGK